MTCSSRFIIPQVDGSANLNNKKYIYNKNTIEKINNIKRKIVNKSND